MREDTTSIVTKYYHKLLEMLYLNEIERGFIKDFSGKKHGVLVTDKHSNVYNFYKYEQFDYVFDFAKYMQGFRIRLLELEYNKNCFPKHIINFGTYLYYLEYYSNVLHSVDRTLSKCELLPIFYHLTEKSTVRYNINIC